MGNIYFLRHGMTGCVENEIYQGVGLCVPLNEQGFEEAQVLVELFREVHLDAVISSVALRAFQSALPLAESKGLDVLLDFDLIERNLGKLVGKSYPGIKDVQKHLFTWAKNYGEPTPRLFSRAEGVRDNLIKHYGDQDIAVLSHNSFLIALGPVLDGREEKFYPEYELDTGHVHHYRIDDGRIECVGLNLDHL